MEIYKTKAGAFEAANIFGRCAGLFEAISVHLAGQANGDAVALAVSGTFAGLANGAEMTGAVFYAPHSNNDQASEVVSKISEGEKDFWLPIISFEGLDDNIVVAELEYCAAYNEIQAVTVKSILKSRYGSSE